MDDDQYALEAEWLQKAQNGDDEAFAYIVEAYQRPVYNLCYRMLGNANDAEDAAQETFLRAYNAIRRYDPRRKFSSWLLTIASNYCIDQHRRRKLPTFSYDGLPVPDIIDNESPRMDAKMINAEREQEIAYLLKELQPTDRSAVILRYWYDYSYDEISDALDLSVSAVKSRLHRARKDLALEWLNLQEENSAPIPERTPYEAPTV